MSPVACAYDLVIARNIILLFMLVVDYTNRSERTDKLRADVEQKTDCRLVSCFRCNLQQSVVALACFVHSAAGRHGGRPQQQ